MSFTTALYIFNWLLGADARASVRKEVEKRENPEALPEVLMQMGYAESVDIEDTDDDEDDGDAIEAPALLGSSDYFVN